MITEVEAASGEVIGGVVTSSSCLLVDSEGRYAAAEKTIGLL